MIVWQLLAGWGAMALVMAGLWGLQRRSGDAGIVDVAWGAGVGLLAAAYAALCPSGDAVRRGLIALLALAWSLRLSGHILIRLRRLPEDGRYQSLRNEWGTRAQRNLFLFFQLQAFWSALFSIPMLIAVRNPEPALNAWDWTALLIWAVAVGGEAIADRQLSRFRHNSANKGKVCREGLWRYSRHPNYFFEWIHWWAWVPLSIGAPLWWVTMAGPLVMLWFLLKVTGVPPTEAQAIRSRGEAYRDYQQTTSAFFPWFPREKASP
jgi:steroid 5-alpha reductase family enzyme